VRRVSCVGLATRAGVSGAAKVRSDGRRGLGIGLVLAVGAGAVWATVAWAAPPATQVRPAAQEQWVLENAALRVEVDGKSGALSVLDKRCGQRWESRPQGPGQTVELTVGPAPQTLKLDGQVADEEWPWPSIALTAANQTEGQDRPRPEDCSAKVRVAWRAEGLVVAVEVADNAVAFPKPGGEQWWEWDSVEFWVGAQQYAVLPAPPGGMLVAVGKGPVAGAQVYARTGQSGWQAEFALPWPAGKPAPDRAVPFALGINDADRAEGGRRFQLYFPASWRHSEPETFARTKFAAQGQPPRAAAAAEATLAQVERLPGAAGLQARAAVRSAGGQPLWEGTLRLWLEEPAELVMEIDRQPTDFPTGRFTILPALGADEPAEIYAAPYCSGENISDSDSRFRGRAWTTYGTLDMPWVGYGVASGRGYVLLMEDPDDAVIVLEGRGPQGRLVPVPYHEPTKGKLGYARRVRYSFLDRGGFVAMCKWYRRYAKQQGILKTLVEKMRTRPQLERIAGAPDFWGIDPSICQHMRRLGVRHAIVNDGWPAEVMESVKALGYLVSRYDNYEDMLEGPRAQYLRGKIPDDVVKLADGSLMKAWLTWDKKTQFMKRCVMLFEEMARLWIPPDLAAHPYNARFIDVTTACGQTECYDAQHPCDRRQDRAARQRLAAYVANELKLVLGGEHGRWWGVPYYDYWEGMQSGGNYSWPAGHVGINLPQKREEIGEAYWEFGIGEQRRLPLWQLVFGDCVVCTWYWGDSTGHLYQVAPEIDDRKDCFNLLYGTVPLFWTNQPFGFNWRDEKLRLRLLQSYFVTCPVHEQVAFSEMTDYRYLTADRTAHESQFASGVKVVVNFGRQVYRARGGGRDYELPQYGFLVTGPGVLAYRALAQGRQVTWVQTPTVLYWDSGAQAFDFGLVRAAGRGAVEIEETGRARLIVLQGGPVQLNLAGWAAQWQPAKVRVYREDEQRRPTECLTPQWQRGWLLGPSGVETAQLLWGQLAERPDLAVRAVTVAPANPRQGDKLKVTVDLRNHGGVGLGRATVALYLDSLGRADELARKSTDIGPAGQALLSFSVATDDFDGRHEILAVADPDDSLLEITKANNQARAAVGVLANPDRWPYRVRLLVDPGGVTRRELAVETELDLAETGAPEQLALDPATVRVVRVENGRAVAQVPAQFEPGLGYDGQRQRRGRLIFVDTLYAGRQAEYWVVVGMAKHRTRTTPPLAWDAKQCRLRTPCYELRFSEGKLVDWRSLLPGAPDHPFLRHLVASDQAFGWSSEQTVHWEAKLLTAGPALAVVEVNKRLPGDFEYVKTYRFYPRYFIVEGKFNKPVAVWSRAAYMMPCHYADSAGHAAEIDGQGQGEGVAGQAPGVKWYAAWTDSWAHSAINLAPTSANLSFWDAGLLGEVGFSTGQTEGLRAAYVLYPGQKGPEFAGEDYAALTTPLQVRVVK
jgi:hypothetical protein